MKKFKKALSSLSPLKISSSSDRSSINSTGRDSTGSTFTDATTEADEDSCEEQQQQQQQQDYLQYQRELSLRSRRKSTSQLTPTRTSSKKRNSLAALSSPSTAGIGSSLAAVAAAAGIYGPAPTTPLPRKSSKKSFNCCDTNTASSPPLFIEDEMNFDDFELTYGKFATPSPLQTRRTLMKTVASPSPASSNFLMATKTSLDVSNNSVNNNSKLNISPNNPNTTSATATNTTAAPAQATNGISRSFDSVPKSSSPLALLLEQEQQQQQQPQDAIKPVDFSDVAITIPDEEEIDKYPSQPNGDEDEDDDGLIPTRTRPHHMRTNGEIPLPPQHQRQEQQQQQQQQQQEIYSSENESDSSPILTPRGSRISLKHKTSLPRQASALSLFLKQLRSSNSISSNQSPVSDSSASSAGSVDNSVSSSSTDSVDSDTTAPFFTEGKHPLLIAAERGNLSKVKQLLRGSSSANVLAATEPVDVNVRDPADKTTALHKAALHNHIEIMKLLIDKGALLDAKSSLGATPLHFAVSKGNIQAVQVLASNGCDMNCRDKYGYSPLTLCFKPRLQQQASKNNAINNGGSSPLSPSPSGFVENIFFDIAADLLLFNADIDIKRFDGKTCIHMACEAGNLPAVKFLLEKGARVNTRDQFKQTPLFLAINSNRIEVVRYLLAERGSSPIFTTDTHRNKPQGNNNQDEIGNDNSKTSKFDALNINLRDDCGHNLLHLACKSSPLQNSNNDSSGRSAPRIINIIVDYLCSLKIMSSAYASRSPTTGISVIDMLVNDCEHTFGNTPLHIAVSRGDLEAVKLLIERLGANVYAANKKGDTPLHIAARNVVSSLRAAAATTAASAASASSPVPTASSPTSASASASGFASASAVSRALTVPASTFASAGTALSSSSSASSTASSPPASAGPPKRPILFSLAKKVKHHPQLPQLDLLNHHDVNVEICGVLLRSNGGMNRTMMEIKNDMRETPRSILKMAGITSLSTLLYAVNDNYGPFVDALDYGDSKRNSGAFIL